MIKEIVEIIKLAIRLSINNQIIPIIIFAFMGYCYENHDIRLRHILFLTFAISCANIFGSIIESITNTKNEWQRLNNEMHTKKLFFYASLIFMPILGTCIYYISPTSRIIVSLAILGTYLYLKMKQDQWLLSAILLSAIASIPSLIGSSMRLGHLNTGSIIHFGAFGVSFCYVFMINTVREYLSYEKDLHNNTISNAIFFGRNISFIYTLLFTSSLIYITFASAIVALLALIIELVMTAKLNLFDIESCQTWLAIQNYIVILLLIGVL